MFPSSISFDFSKKFYPQMPSKAEKYNLNYVFSKTTLFSKIQEVLAEKINLDLEVRLFIEALFCFF